MAHAGRGLGTHYVSELGPARGSGYTQHQYLCAHTYRLLHTHSEHQRMRCSHIHSVDLLHENLTRHTQVNSRPMVTNEADAPVARCTTQPDTAQCPAITVLRRYPPTERCKAGPRGTSCPRAVMLPARACQLQHERLDHKYALTHIDGSLHQLGDREHEKGKCRCEHIEKARKRKRN